jgi:hypothetical protein
MSSSSNCKLRAYESANKQNTVYDSKNNEILYGINNHMKVSGVSDGTCNQINPMMQRYSGRCGVGAAGGNPCYPNTIEPFNSEGSPCNINGFITILFLILILLLFITANSYSK